jgi:acyl-CoA reductase-like NAD-dependent aldehyde dehydrogenase
MSVEAAGAGFAAAIAMADRYAGQEVSSTQALVDAGIELPDESPGFPIDGLTASRTSIVTDPALDTPARATAPPPAATANAQVALVRRVRATLAEQAEGWRHRSFFERQWMLRDFKQRAGMPVEGWLEWLGQLEARIESGRDGFEGDHNHIARLAAFYDHLAELARGYVKDADEREEQLRVVASWRREVEELAAALAALRR